VKDLGEHPSEGGKVQVLSGRYGPYVKHGDVNATLPRGKEPAELTMDEAVLLIAERAAKGPSKKKGRKGKAAKAKPEAAADAADKKPAKAKAKTTDKPAKAKAAPARKKAKGKASGTREAAE
jgi:DNA topoisomerase-1